MSRDNTESMAKQVWKEIAGEALSPSHDHWHVDRVMAYAKELQAIYGGDLTVLEAAVIMHDLGRIDPGKRGEESIEESIEHAQHVLDNLGDVVSASRKESILLAIREHDKPDYIPSTIEGKILKDADFLAGFGAWGVLRIAMWAGETKGGVVQILERLEVRMRNRIEGLCFDESKRVAIREYSFARLFSSLLHEQPELISTPHRGLYVILEGISGSGKDTQAKHITAELQNHNLSCKIVHEPGEHYKRIRDTWQAASEGRKLSDPILMRYLMMADRYQGITEQVTPSLKEYDIVLSVRSFVSTLVYQSRQHRELSELHFMHRWVPIPDLLIILDLDPEIALERIKNRDKKGLFETLPKMRRHRQSYLQLAKDHLLSLDTEIVNAGEDEVNITAECIELILKTVENS